LLGARLIEWSQPTGERIVRLNFIRGGEQTTFVAELIPPGGNLLLLDANERVLARLFNDDRNGKAGRPYIPPPAVSGAGEAKVRPWSGPSFHQFLAALYPDNDKDTAAEEQARKDARKRDTLLRKLEDDLKRAGEPDDWRRQAAALAALDGMPALTPEGRATIADPATGEKLEVRLQPGWSLHENVEALYKKARRAESAKKHIEERRKLLEETPVTMRAAPQKKSAREKPIELPPGHVFRYPGGSLIVVGRGAEENERVTYGFAGGEDHWLHARGAPGSHVIVRHAGEDELESLLDDGARLALHYSFKRGEPSGDVQWTQKKYVQRVKGATGKVRLIREENRRVNVSDEDLMRIETLRVRREAKS
jgi:predicted ribosome quality control (RQC) complex YloA/Tae2 family protein